MLAFISLFSNVITQLNDYAIENGINEETIQERNDQYNRLKDVMFEEFSKYYEEGTLFGPTKDEQDKMYAYGKEQGLSDRLYNMMYTNYRFGVGYTVITEIKNKRDNYRKGTEEYDKYDNKLKDLRAQRKAKSGK